MKSNKVIIGIVLILLVVIVGVLIWFGIKTANASKYTKADEYTLGSKTIPSVKAVVGEKKVKSYKHSKSNIETLVLNFEDSDGSQTVEKYMDHIKDSGNYVEAKRDEGSKVRILSNSEKGNLFTVKSEVTDNGFTLTIENGPGSVKIDPIEE